MSDYSCFTISVEWVFEKEVLLPTSQKIRQTAKAFAEFRCVNNRTGGGPGIDPPDEDGEAEPHDDLLPIGVEDSLKVLCVQEVVNDNIEGRT